jgi:hypothetical protein
MAADPVTKLSSARVTRRMALTACSDAHILLQAMRD